jgi:hypothetical protein
VETLCDELFTGAAFAYYENGTIHRGRTRGALNRVKKGDRLANKLIFAFQFRSLDQPIVKIPNLWQAKPKGNFEQLLKPLFYVYFTSLAQPLPDAEHTAREFRKMFNREFIQSKLGKASVASVAAMTLFVALSTQMHIAPAVAATPVASGLLVEMA